LKNCVALAIIYQLEFVDLAKLPPSHCATISGYNRLMAQSTRLLIEGPAPGAWNMAVDEALLRTAAETGVWTLRIYRWSTPTLSLGYFQSQNLRHSHGESLTCDWLRRATGGGAILHHHELTYALAFPATDRLAQKHEQFYEKVHQSICAALHRQSVVARRCTEAESAACLTPDAFLCFERRTAGDVLCEHQKIGGSAQRRWKNAILQHGSLIVRTSPFAPQVLGLNEISGIELDEQQFIAAFLDELQPALNVQFQSGELNDQETQVAKQLECTKFAADDWNRKR
jgi:lipoate-protein ligase A